MLSRTHVINKHLPAQLIIAQAGVMGDVVSPTLRLLYYSICFTISASSLAQDSVWASL